MYTSEYIHTEIPLKRYELMNMTKNWIDSDKQKRPFHIRKRDDDDADDDRSSTQQMYKCRNVQKRTERTQSSCHTIVCVCTNTVNTHLCSYIYFEYLICWTHIVARSVGFVRGGGHPLPFRFRTSRYMRPPTPPPPSLLMLLWPFAFTTNRLDTFSCV